VAVEVSVRVVEFSTTHPRPARGLVRLALSALALTGLPLQGSSALAAPIGVEPLATAVQLAQAGLPDCVVPDLRGKTVPQIEYHGILQGRRDGNPTHYCRLGAVTTLHPARRAHGQPLVVVSQSPRAGRTVPYYTAVALTVGPARRALKPGPCHLLAGSEAVARSPGLLVYRTAADVPDGPNSHVLEVTWRACVRSSGARQTIHVSGNADDPIDVLEHFAVGGLYVAFTIDTTDRSGDSTYRRIVLVDLTSGRQMGFDVPGIGTPPGLDPLAPGRPPPLADVPAIVVNAKGFIAWVIGYPGASGLFVHDSHGTRLVDQAAGSAITNLRLGGHTLSWTNAGMARAATLA
jgi:hypothetical protein